MITRHGGRHGSEQQLQLRSDNHLAILTRRVCSPSGRSRFPSRTDFIETNPYIRDPFQLVLIEVAVHADGQAVEGIAHRRDETKQQQNEFYVDDLVVHYTADVITKEFRKALKKIGAYSKGSAVYV